jgi:thiosulfate/3-mercaptopyruvate sulfurtransferase
VAGHIPGARNHPFVRNVDAKGRFLPAGELRERWQATLGGGAVGGGTLGGAGAMGAVDAAGTARAVGKVGVADATAAKRAIAMCGSGVTACHNLLALEIAGLPGARLYAGSWSEWIRDPARPVTRST